MKGYKLRISDERDEDVFRDILLPEDVSFEDFHFAILDSFEIEAGEMASFYLSDDNWNKNQEITLMDMGLSEDGNKTALMQSINLNSVMNAGVKKLLYVYDFLFCKNFKITLLGEENAEEITPMLLDSVGEYKVDNSGLTDLLLSELGDDTEDDMLSNKKKKGPDIMEGFDDFDNFQDDDENQFENIDDLDI